MSPTIGTGAAEGIAWYPGRASEEWGAASWCSLGIVVQELDFVWFPGQVSERAFTVFYAKTN